MDILGIRLGPEPKADDEYVASVRAWTRYPRRSAVANACAIMLFWGILILWAWLSQGLMLRMAERQGVYGPSIAVGMMFAMWSGWLVAWGAYPIILGGRGPRSTDCQTECLMLRFHDEWNGRNAGDAAPVPAGNERPRVGRRTILSIRLRAERRTDPQYVEFVRELVRQFRWVRIIEKVLSALCLLGAIGLIVLWAYLVGTLPPAPEELPPFISISAGWPGVIVGVAWGIIAAWILSRMGEPLSRLARVLAGCRVERLMLKYYDELYRREGDNQAAPTAGQ